MNNLIGIAASAAIATVMLGSVPTFAQSDQGQTLTGIQYIEGTSYRSKYAGNNEGEWSHGKDPDSPCYHGNYGYNGQTSNYDHSKCVVVYDAQTYTRLLRGSSSMGGTQYYGQ